MCKKQRRTQGGGEPPPQEGSPKRKKKRKKRGRKKKGKKKGKNNGGGEEGERKKEPREKSRKCVCSFLGGFPVEAFSFLLLLLAFFSPAKITLLSGIFDNARCEVKDFEHIMQ